MAPRWGTGGGGGGAPVPCTLAVSGPVTTGTYRECALTVAPQGGDRVNLSANVLPGCGGCMFIAEFWPDAIGTAATSTSSMASCTVNTSQLDLAGGHWSGNIDAFLLATDFNFMTVGFAHVTLSRSL